MQHQGRTWTGGELSVDDSGRKLLQENGRRNFPSKVGFNVSKLPWLAGLKPTHHNLNGDPGKWCVSIIDLGLIWSQEIRFWSYIRIENHAL